MSQLMSGNDGVADEKWVARLQELSATEKAVMLAWAVKLLDSPDVMSSPMESEVGIWAEQLYLSLGRHLLAR